MTLISKEFNSYNLAYQSHQHIIDFDTFSKTGAVIALRFNNQTVAVLRFQDELPVPKNTFNTSTLVFDLHYHLNKFNDIINILRYEKPLFVHFETDNFSGGIQTSMEPVGEEE